MKILVILDKFKGCFTSSEISSIIENLLKEQGFQNISKIAVSDGGDGFLEAISQNTSFQINVIHTYDALLRPIKTYFLSFKDTAYIESAKIIGLSLLNKKDLDIKQSTSYGLGVAIKYCLDNGFKKIYIGLGGSATNDAGIGMAYALGHRFFDKNNKEFFPKSINLKDIERIEKVEYPQNIEILGLCDVTNPLYGQNGAAYKFAKQKGADHKTIEILDEGLKKIFYLSQNQYKNQKYFGAAGGLGFGLKFFLNAKLSSGAKFILKHLEIEKYIKESDIVITGEGKFDDTSLMGKITGEIIHIAQKYSKKIVIITGQGSIKLPYLTIINLFENSFLPTNLKEKSLEKIQKLNFRAILQLKNNL